MPAVKENLTIAATLGLDYKVRKCANLIGDEALLRKISIGDLVAIDAFYHLSCLTGLYRKAKKFEAAQQTSYK